MLSFILALTFRFEREHGYAPNLVYLNTEQFQTLRGELEISPHGTLAHALGMQVVIFPGLIHPEVVFSTQRAPGGLASLH